MLGAISPPGKISRGFSMRHARTDFSIRTVLASSGSLRGGTCRACVCGGALVAVCVCGGALVAVCVCGGALVAVCVCGGVLVAVCVCGG